MSWFETVRDTVQKVYEFINNEETIGDTLSEFAYTVQTGYPRYILNNFSIRDLEKFLDHPHIDSFFIIVREVEDELMYGLIFKSPSRGWRVSTVVNETKFVNLSLEEFLTGKISIEDEEYVDEYRIITPKILQEEEEYECIYEDIGPTQENILLLRPKTGSFSHDKTRKLIAYYEAKKEAPQELDSEQYIFHLILSQPEYLEPERFNFIRKLVHKTLKTDSTTTAKYCKDISTLFSDSFRTYRVGLLI